MKLVRQIVLHFREGTSDKVYEVDLCELGVDRFVVNFRFGRRGAKLQDGSKTPLPVDRKTADKVYDALVREKTAKGYRPADAGPAPEPVATEVRFEDVEDPRHRKLLALLAGRERGWTDNPDKLAWRAGELRIRAAAPLLVELLRGATNRRAWHVCRALLRAGDPAALPALFGQWEASGTAPFVRSMAAHAIVAISPPEAADRFRRRLAAGLPEGVLEALAAERMDVVAAACAADPALPDLLYVVAEDAHRPGLVALLEALPFREPSFVGVRRVLQAAEARGDGLVWGALARPLETERPAVSRVMRRRSGERAGAWSTGTRKWWRRRAWRTLLRLATAGAGSEYVSLASGLLAALREEDVPGGWAVRQWAAGHVLFGGDARTRTDGRRLRLFPERPIAGQRTERWPQLWDGAPEHLARLLSRSRCGAVHTFAARALRANPGAWPSLPIAELVSWLGSPYPDTVALAAHVAVTRYDPRHPDLALVVALLGCPDAGVRATAEGWVRANPAPFLRDVELVLRLILHAEATTRRFALDLLSAATLPPDRARVLVEAVCEAALRTDAADEDASARLRDATVVLVTAFPTELRSLDLDLVHALVRHPAAGAAELGARILLVHSTRPADLPDAVLADAMTSPHPTVRGIGIRLYGELPDAVLAERFRVLLALVANPLPDVRAASHPIIARLARTNPGFGRTFLRALLPTLTREGPPGLHADLVTLLRSELAAVLAELPADSVFQLLRAHETVVQELGGELLRTNVDPATLTLAQLAVLAASDVLLVRRTAWTLLDQRADDARRDPDAVLPLLDAPWEDSRANAFRWVREKVGPEHLGAAVTITVCDSVRPDVQAFGRSLVTTVFDAADGGRYLAALAQHPDPEMQAYASAWLESHASGDPERLGALLPFFAAVLQRPNRAKTAKTRVLAFLAKEGLRDEASARLVASVLVPLSASIAKTHREAAIATLTAIHAAFPTVPTGLLVVAPEVRGAV